VRCIFHTTRNLHPGWVWYNVAEDSFIQGQSGGFGETEEHREAITMGMTVYNPDGTVASVFTGIKRNGDRLVLQQLALGQVAMDVIITPEEALKSLKLGLSLGLITFVLFFPYFWLKYKIGERSAKKDKP
jgi:hypothetical protein